MVDQSEVRICLTYGTSHDRLRSEGGVFLFLEARFRASESTPGFPRMVMNDTTVCVFLREV
jgi:hypothetical protein